MFDQEKFFGMGQQCTTHQIENYLRPTPTLLFHMSSHKKADHTKGDDKWAGAKVILSLNYELWGSSHVLEMFDIVFIWDFESTYNIKSVKYKKDKHILIHRILLFSKIMPNIAIYYQICREFF